MTPTEKKEHDELLRVQGTLHAQRDWLHDVKRRMELRANVLAMALHQERPHPVAHQHEELVTMLRDALEIPGVRTYYDRADGLDAKAGVVPS
jgi:hypothetical protein